MQRQRYLCILLLLSKAWSLAQPWSVSSLGGDRSVGSLAFFFIFFFFRFSPESHETNSCRSSADGGGRSLEKTVPNARSSCDRCSRCFNWQRVNHSIAVGVNLSKDLLQSDLPFALTAPCIAISATCLREFGVDLFEDL